MDRRSFIRLLGAGLVAPIIEPKVKYILPPIGGWLAPINPTSISFELVETLPLSYKDYLRKKGALLNLDFDLAFYKMKYLDLRALDAWKVVFKQTPNTIKISNKQRSS